MTWIAGADVFKKGWYVVLADLQTGAWSARQLPRFADVLSMPEQPEVICVDMPIGMPEFTLPGGRECERSARSVLGPRARASFRLSAGKHSGSSREAKRTRQVSPAAASEWVLKHGVWPCGCARSTMR
jgi:predicted RNase H-like nuclease